MNYDRSGALCARLPSAIRVAMDLCGWRNLKHDQISAPHILAVCRRQMLIVHNHRVSGVYVCAFPQITHIHALSQTAHHALQSQWSYLAIVRPGVGYETWTRTTPRRWHAMYTRTPMLARTRKEKDNVYDATGTKKKNISHS